MKQAKDLVANALSNAGSVTEAPQPAKIDNATAMVINKLFAELQSIFPAWRQAWPDDKVLRKAKQSWIKAFMAVNLSSLEQIRYGIEQCRLSGSDFAPSVGKFIEWCKPTPEMLGLPDAEKAYKRACSMAYDGAAKEGDHPAVFHAAKETGFYELKHLPQDKSWPLFKRAYQITIDALLAGKPLQEIPKALPETVSVKARPETAQANIAAARAILGRTKCEAHNA